MPEAEQNKRRLSSGETLIIFFSIFTLALALLITSVRLLKQPTIGFNPTVLLVIGLVGILGSLYGMLASYRSRSQQPVVVEVPQSQPAPAPAPTQEAGEAPENVARVRLGKYVQVLEEQSQALRQENAQLRDEVGELRQYAADWQKRSLEMFRYLDKLSKSEPGEGVRSMKKHLAQLVAPLGVGIIEPEPGDPYDEKMHQADNSPESGGAESLIIAECLEWGYSLNGRVETPAKVVVAKASDH